MSDWWKFDSLSFDEDTLDEQIGGDEHAALEAINSIAALAESQPDKVLVVGAALRKIATVAQSHAQTISLRSMTIRKTGAI